MDLVVIKRALGLASIAVGVAATAAPERLSRWLGLESEPETMTAFGARELASGAGLLSPVKPGPFFWMRVAGDVIDMSALAKAVRRENPRRTYAAALLGLVAAIAIVDLAAAAHATLNKRADARAAT